MLNVKGGHEESYQGLENSLSGSLLRKNALVGRSSDCTTIAVGAWCKEKSESEILLPFDTVRNATLKVV